MNGARARVTLTLLGLLAGGPAVGADPAAAPPEAAVPQDPQALAKALFDQIREADTYDLATIERLYHEVMEKCPETDQAQESYWRLSNLYLQAYDDPKYPEARALLERFLTRYPDSDGVPVVKRRLAYVYEEMKDWPRTVEIYSELFAAPEVPAEVVQEYGFSYAQALKNSGRGDEARTWYRRFLDAMQGQDDFRMRIAEEDLKGLDRLGDTAPTAPASAAAVPAAEAAAPDAGGTADKPEARAADSAAPAPTAPAVAEPRPPLPAARPPASAETRPAAGTPAATGAESQEQAARLQRDATSLQGAGDYLGALQAYRQSLALRPDPQVAARVKKLEAYLKTRGIDVPPAP